MGTIRATSRDEWSRGLTVATGVRVEQMIKRNTYPNERVFTANGPVLNGPALVKRLIAMGWAYECAICRIAEWCSRPHTQTPTFSNRRR